MKHFSEAIRDGSKLNPQCKTGWTGLDENGQPTTCAAMAGLIDLGFYKVFGDGTFEGNLESEGMQYDERQGRWGKAAKLPKQFEFITKTNADSPCACQTMDEYINVMGVIVHLNDHHKWTREAISEWVETVERKLGLWDEEKKEEKSKEVLCTEVAPWDSVFDGTPVNEQKKG